MQLLHKAAGVVENNGKHALETAHNLSHQLRAAEDRISELPNDAFQETVADEQQSPAALLKSRGRLFGVVSAAIENAVDKKTNKDLASQKVSKSIFREA